MLHPQIPLRNPSAKTPISGEIRVDQSETNTRLTSEILNRQGTPGTHTHNVETHPPDAAVELRYAQGELQVCTGRILAL